MNHKQGHVVRLTFLVLAVVLFACGLAGIWRARTLALAALDGRAPAKKQEDRQPTSFELLAEMRKSQTLPKIGGWLSVVEAQTVVLNTPRGRLSAQLYPPLSGEIVAPLAILFHGGPGSSSAQVQDIACELSLAGYRVLTTDLYGHGQNEGRFASWGGADAQDVIAWTEWAQAEQMNSRVVLFGQDEGALAVMLAAPDLPEAAAIALDSPYQDVPGRLWAQLTEAGVKPRLADGLLLQAAYALLCKAPLQKMSAEQLAGVDVPMLFLHGTGDEVNPAYISLDLAEAAHAAVQFVEGAPHGMARYLDPDAYYKALIGFFDRAVR